MRNRFTLALAALVVVLAIAGDVSACHRRGGRHHAASCSSSTSSCSSCQSGQLGVVYGSPAPSNGCYVAPGQTGALSPATTSKPPAAMPGGK